MLIPLWQFPADLDAVQSQHSAPRSVWSARGLRHQGKTWRCDAVESGEIPRFLRIMDDMVNRLWLFPAGLSDHAAAAIKIWWVIPGFLRCCGAEGEADEAGRSVQIRLPLCV